MATLLNMTDAGKRIGISGSLACRYATSGRLRVILIGRRRFATVDEADRLKAELRSISKRRNGGKRKRGAVRASRERTI